MKRSGHSQLERQLFERSRFLGLLILASLATLLLLLSFQQAQAAITLASFTATYSPGQILVRWETATEFQTAGFYVQRSLQPASGFTRISPLIYAEGENYGWTYIYTDTQNIVVGTTYYYILEEIERDNTSVLHGPISVYAGIETLTPTASASPTASSSPTSSATGPTPTASRTVTRTPTRTATRTRTPINTSTPIPTFTASATWTDTPTFTPSATITPTQTLEPLPTLVYTLELTPSHTPTDTPTPSETPTPLPTIQEPRTPGSLFMNWIRSGAIARIALIAIIIAFWAILAIGGYLYIRHYYL